MDGMAEIEMDMDPEDLPPAVRAKFYRKMVRALLSKKGKPRDDEETDKADDERDALALLHDEKKTGGSAETDEDESADDAEQEAPVKKKPTSDAKG